MARISSTEFYNDKDILTQIEWLKANLPKAVLEDIQLSEDASSGTVTMTLSFADGTTMTRTFQTTAVTSITGTQTGNQLTLTFHLANGQTYSTTFTVTVTATASWSSLTGQPSDSNALTERINGLAQVKVADETDRAETAETALGGRMTTLEATVAALAKTLFPVGSIRLTADNVNPGTYITGTTWVAWGAGRVIRAVGGDFTSPEATGGSDTVQLTVAQLPSHTHVANAHSHAITVNSAGAHTHTVRTSGSYTHGTGAGSAGTTEESSGSAGDHSHTATAQEATVTLQSTGNGAEVDIKNSYITAYAWKRTA